MAIDWTQLIDSLRWVERLDTKDAGLLSFGATPGGGIFVENRRICWAAAQGLEARLRELLLRATELELALRRHSAESLIKLCDTRRPVKWSARDRGYLPRFTFSPLEVLLDIVDLELGDSRERARAELAPWLGPARVAASFHSDARSGTLVPVATLGEVTSVEFLARLGAWAARMPLITSELGALPSFTLATTATGETVSIWSRAELLNVVVCSDRSTAAAVTGHRLASARPIASTPSARPYASLMPNVMSEFPAVRI